MSQFAPETLALGKRGKDQCEVLLDMEKLDALAHKYFLDQRFPDLPKAIEEIRSKAQEEYLGQLEEHRRAPHYEISVADAAAALGVSENTIRKWDIDGCPDDPNYPGRFHAVPFYQWARSYQSMKRFNREAKKRAILMNVQ